jgi:hypothetical protein
MTSLRRRAGKTSKKERVPSIKKFMNTKMKKIQTAAFGVPEFEMKPEANYRPRISAEHLCRLWLLKQYVKKPITVLVAEALDSYLENMKWAIEEKGGEK